VTGGFAETIVLFDVEDVNDCQPRFANDSYSLAVSEAVPVGTVVLKLTATDGDSAGPNSDISFSIVHDKNNASDIFEVDAASGQLMLKRHLDRERQKRHLVTVVATDRGSPRPLSATTLVVVDVVDSNDNAPEFDDADYQVPLSDRAVRGQFVAKVRAFDQDEQGQLVYSITGGNLHQVKIQQQKKCSTYIPTWCMAHCTVGSFVTLRVKQKKSGAKKYCFSLPSCGKN
jgi:hypothetical protein